RRRHDPWLVAGFRPGDDSNSTTNTRSSEVKPQNSRRVIDAFPSAAADLPWSEGILAGEWLFAGAQLASDGVNGLDPGARPAADSPWTQSPLGLESALVLERIVNLLDAAGGD